MAFPTGWLRKCPLVVQHGKVATDADTYPVLLTEANLPASIFTDAQADGGDLRFTSDSAGASQLACEVALWSGGRAEVWVSASVRVASDTTLYVWYKAGGGQTQPALSAPFGAQAVWNFHYHSIYHMSQASGAQLRDSTNYGHDSSANTGTSVAGKVGNALSYDGVAGRTDIPAPFSAQSGYTIAAWVKATPADYGVICDMRGGGALGPLFYTIKTSGHAGSFFNPPSDQAESTVVAADGTWHYVVGTRANDGVTMTVYVDGNPGVVKILSQAYPVWGATTGFIGADNAGVFYALAVDELRVLDIELPAVFVLTDFANQSSPGTFVLPGSVVTIGGGGGGASGPVALGAYQSLALTSGTPVQLTSAGNYRLAILNTGPGRLFVSAGSSPGANAQSMVVPPGQYAPQLSSSAAVWLATDQDGGVSIIAAPRG